MGGQKPEKTKKRICIGILAHVDAGKTTLSEGLLYLCGEIRKLGRVDHGDAFLDTYEAISVIYPGCISRIFITESLSIIVHNRFKIVEIDSI